MKLTKLESDSQAQVKDRSLKKNLISRLLRNREISVVPIDADHMPYLWAAYRMGVWDEVFKPNLTQEEFTNAVAQTSEVFNLMVIVSEKPISLVSIKQDTVAVQPNIEWFPWASNRNKVEGVVKLILYLRDISPVILWSKDESRKFFTHISKYGIMRRVGTFHGDEKYAIFQSKEA